MSHAYRKKQRTNELKAYSNYTNFLVKKSVSEQQLGTVLTYLSCTRNVPQLLMSR